MTWMHPRVGIVGGRGRMGRWLARILEGQGLEVLISGRHTSLKPVEMARQCDVVVISVPIQATIDVIKEIGPALSEEGLLMDLTSLKSAPVAAMLRHSKAQVVGLHPLFGPGEKTKRGLRVVLCPGRGEQGMTWIRNVFFKAGLEVILLKPEAHDRTMGLIQGLGHFSTLALALSISRSGLPLEDIEGLATPAFEQKLERIRYMTKQSAELFGALLMDNPRATPFQSQYLESADQLIEVVKAKDREAFSHLFSSITDFFNREPAATRNAGMAPVKNHGH